ncbi:MAG TPA: YhjD/YihY/BrkB family envelope integrity protein [Candidatus Methylacidiphilales bacterium]|nr:YhjD/YihY/BrkB family envelope integrity protein [Candidatus Methylacidiphilales bacterium]
MIGAILKWLFGPLLVTKLDRLGTYASALAYCFVLSLIPFLVVTFTLAAQFAPKNVDLTMAYENLLTDILPAELASEASRPPGTGEKAPAPAPPLHDETLREKAVSVSQVANLSAHIIATLKSTSHRGLATIGFILAVYTSFNLMDQIVKTLVFIFDDPRRPSQWSWMLVVKTVALLFIWALLLLLISIVSVVTPVIQNILGQLHLNSNYWTAPLLVARDLVMMAALFGAFFLTYYLVPVRAHSLAVVRDGSLVAAFGWVLCSLIFAYVLPNMWRANAVYEALGSVVIILLWALSCSWCVILGACWIVRFSPGKAKRT